MRIVGGLGFELKSRKSLWSFLTVHYQRKGGAGESCVQEDLARWLDGGLLTACA